MFHLNPKPSPPTYVGRDTPGHAVDSSAAEMTPGSRACTQLVELLQERDRLEILAAAEAVRHPLALLARVVEVEHRRDRVDAQPVDVVLAQPEERVREQEVLHLGAAEVEDVACPSRDGGRGAGRRARRARCRRSARAPTDRSRSARAPSRGSRRCRSRAGGRRSSGSRRASPSSRRSRRSSSPGSPTSRRTGGASPAAARRA